MQHGKIIIGLQKVQTVGPTYAEIYVIVHEQVNEMINVILIFITF